MKKWGRKLDESREANQVPGWRRRAQPGEGVRVREAAGFLTVGRASRGDEGFVQQLQEIVGNMVTAQMGEGAGGFLLPKTDVSDWSLTLP